MNDNNINQIEKYIDGDLHGEALNSFEKRLKTDKSLAKEYNQRIKFARLWIDADEYSKTKTEIGNIIKNQSKNIFRIKKFYILSFAATIIILFGVYLLLKHTNNTNENVLENKFANVMDSSSNIEDTIVFKYDKTDKFAKLDTVSGYVNLLFPVNGELIITSQPITFKWKSNSNKNDTLYVINKSDGMTILKIKVALSDTIYTIMHPQIANGNFLWYISDSTNYGKFTLINK